MAFGATSEVNEKKYLGYSGTGPLVYPFSHTSVDDLNVTVGGNPLPKSGWTFSGNAVEGGFDGGSITLIEAVDNQDVVIFRDMVRLRTTKLGVGGANSKDIDAELTRLVLMAQDAKRNYDAVLAEIVQLKDDIEALDAVGDALPAIQVAVAAIQDGDSNLNKAAAIADIIQFLYDESQDGGSLAHIYDNRSELARFVGYLPAVTYASLDGLIITDNRTTVTHDAGSGLNTYAPNPDVLPYTVPTVFDPSAWRLLELASEVEQTDIDDLRVLIDRLNTYHPNTGPTFKNLPPLVRASDWSGKIIDLETRTNPGDFPLSALTYTATGLPAGFVLDENNEVDGVTPPVTSPVTVTFTVTDPLGATDTAQTTIEVYDAAAPAPDEPPTWESLPQLTYVRGNPIDEFDVGTFANDPDGDDGAITYAVTGLPAGLTYSNNRISGTPTAAAGSYTLTWTATDEDSLTTNATQTIVLQEATPPAFTDIPLLAVERGTVMTPIDYRLYASDANTPDNELTFAVTGNPNGTSLSGAVLSGTPTAEDTYAVDVTVTNRAGLTATRRHFITVTATSGSSTAGEQPSGTFTEIE